MLVLPLAAFGLCWVLAAHYRRWLGFARLSLRGCLVIAYVAFQLILLLLAELSSVGHHFTAGVDEAIWASVVVVLTVVARRPLVAFARRLATPGARWGSIRAHLGKLDTEDRIWAAVPVAITAVLVAVGALYRPNNTDSMVYHLARVEHWIQDRTIAPFATHYLAQVELSPLAEYNLAQLHLLAGTDRYDAAAQLLASAVCIIGVTELARLLGARRRVQITAAVVCATIPTGILVATSTENDYVAAATSLCLLVVVAGFTGGQGWIQRSVVVGVAAGLTYMTKGTTPALIGPPVLALLAVAGFRRWRARGWGDFIGDTTARLALLIGGVAVVCVPFLVQNENLFGSVFGSVSGPTTKATIIAGYNPAAMAANIVRTTALNFDIGDGAAGISTYVSRIALGVLHPIYNVFGIAQNDGRYTLVRNFDPFVVTDYSGFNRLEDYGANPWLVLLMVAAVVVLVVGVWKGRRALIPVLALAAGLVVGYLVFNGFARWSPYVVRYSLPLLVAWSAVIAIALARFRRWVGRLVMAALLIACLPQLLDSATRPLVPPAVPPSSSLVAYFPTYLKADTGPQEAAAYRTITNVVAQSSCTRAALGNWVLLEYPLWAALDQDGWKGQLTEVDVHNPTRSLEAHSRPCASITQQGPHYVTPMNGTVNVQQEDLAVSLVADHARSVHGPVVAFGSSVPGATVLPGGGWNLAGLGDYALLGPRGTLYLFSDGPRTVQLRFDLAQTVPQALLSVAGPGGTSAAIRTGDVDVATIHVDEGTNLLTLTTSPSPQTSRRLVVLTHIGINAAAPPAAGG